MADRIGYDESNEDFVRRSIVDNRKESHLVLVFCLQKGELVKWRYISTR
jgi:hypothetical protein